MSRVLVSAALLWVWGLSTGAQVVYEPVQYQYQSGGRTYYYGGANTRVHQSAQAESGESGWGRSNGWAFHSGNHQTHREVATEPVRVYSDQVSRWNAHVFGYTPDDARNAAYNNAPRYFRKADLPALARVQWDGTWLVPSQPALTGGSVQIKPWRGWDEAKKTVEPKPILIIPKHLLDKPLWPKQDLRADAR